MSAYYQVGTYPQPNACGNNFYTGANNGNLDCQINVNDNALNSGEQQLISSGIQEIINRYGSTVAYYTNTYNVSAADNIYGEDPTSTYYGPTNVLMYIQLTEDNTVLRRFGFDGDDVITAYIHISSFYTTFNALSVYSALSQAVEPKAGDVFQMTQYGATRPGDRNGKFFEITERVDQSVGEGINMLGGHYLWKIRAKRLDYSFEPGLSGEKGSAQVFDNAFNGILSGGMQQPSNEKTYPSDASTDSINKVYDQRAVNTSVYGEYGYDQS
jgi:hypothetical protein